MKNSRAKTLRVLVTGATGYIGSNLVKRLIAEGWDVHIVVRPGSDLTILGSNTKALTVHVHDVATNKMVGILKEVQPDLVIHLASLFLAQHRHEDIAALVNSNLVFSTQLVDAMVVNGVKHLINTGTSWQHHSSEGYNPVNLYAATKQAFEDILAYYCDAHQLKVTTLALFDTYGPKDPRPKLMKLLWDTAVTQQPLSMSPGQQLIDLVYIDDVIDAYMLACKLNLKEGVSNKYGVSSGAPISLIDLVTAFEQATKLSLPISWGGRPYRPREVMVPWMTYKKIPGWSPRIPFSTGVLRSKPNNF